MSPAKLTLSPHRIEAAVFDLDGVLTDTARIHAGAWKDTFDAFLKHRAEREGQAFEPFDDEAEYLAYVDGRRRRDGVRTFLASRRIAVPEGSPDDPPGSETVEGIARAKDDLVQERLRRSAVPMPGAKALLSSLRDCGVRVAVASSSANCGPVLAATSLAQFADARVDGIDARELEFPGKPDPAMFLEALQRLGVGPDRAAVFEDALAGVEAGRRADFALVVGVGDGEHGQALLAQGAHVVVRDLSEVSVG